MLGRNKVGDTGTMDKRLSDVSLKFQNEQSDFIFDKVLTPLIVNTTTGNIARYRGEELKEQANETAWGVRPGQSITTMDDDLVYNLRRYAGQYRVLDIEQTNAVGGPISPLEDAVEDATHTMMIKMENVCSRMFSSQTASKTLSGSSKWSEDTSNPLDDIKVARQALSAVGKIPNVAVMNYNGYLALVEHPSIAALLPSNTHGVPMEEDLKKILRVDRIVISRVNGDSTRLGETAVKSFVWSDDFYLAHIPTTKRRAMTTFGFYITLSGYTNRTLTEYDELAGATLVQSETAAQFLPVDTENLYRIANVI